MNPAMGGIENVSLDGIAHTLLKGLSIGLVISCNCPFTSPFSKYPAGLPSRQGRYFISFKAASIWSISLNSTSRRVERYFAP